MSGAKFTKGDWVAEAPSERHIMECGADITTYEVNCGEKEVCGFVFLESNGYSLEEVSANANLIAAAPELYNALDMLMDTSGPGDAAQLLAEERENIMEILAKARGETV